jgi:hypothetical protein
VGVRVDETGRRDQAGPVDFDVGMRIVERADFDDAVAAYADLAVKPRRASAVDNCRVADDQVVMLGRGHGGQSSFAPDFLTTSAHFTVSFLTNAPNASGVPPIGSASMAA